MDDDLPPTVQCLQMKRISFLYLILPFFFFLFGWVRLAVAIPIALIFVFVLYKLFFTDRPISAFHFSLSNIYWFLTIILWLLLSGVGGYAFQNWDHNWRNVVLLDLMNFDWPVYYAQPESGPVKMLVYYVGFWLPAAWVGKLFNWQAANFALFLWTLIGLLLVTQHLGNILKTSAFKASLLLVFFSGLDVLGALFFPQDYPTLLPPITHLETWAGNLQYSSFTTQLFWVFNQAVPAWLCIVLIIRLSKEQETRQDSRAQIALLWSLCFFFAPLASVGLIPYILIEFFKQTDFRSPFKNLLWEQLFAAIVIFLLSVVFFAANTAAQSRGFQSLPFDKFLSFFLLEGGILWLVLAPSHWKDARWIVTGVLLIILPFIQLGSDRDFVMRASIAPLFYLMWMTGETIFSKTTLRWGLIACYSLLVIGSLTPIYEINRSIYRTVDYYFIQEDDCNCDVPSFDPVTRLAQPGVPEEEHPGSLTADALPTLQFMTDELSQNFIANVRQTFFYQYLASH